MVSGDGDYYWQDLFEQGAQRADVELAGFRQRVADAATEQSWRVYASPLVESQRQLNRLRADRLARTAKLIEAVDSYLPDSFPLELLRTRITESFAVRTAIQGLATKSFDKDLCLKLEATLKDLSSATKDLEVSIDVKDKDLPSALTDTADKGFQLGDVPREELRRRLNRGEIAPRDEWLPTSKTKKKIAPEETAERLAFADRLRQEGNEASSEKRWQNASTLYAQGVSLLEHVTSVNLADAMTIQQYLSTFRRNQAIANTHLKKYRDAIASCDAALEDDDGDGKALYLRGRAYQLLGDLDAALTDFKSLATSPNASDESRKIGKHMWREVAKENTIHSEKMRTTYNIAQMDWCPEGVKEVDRPSHGPSDLLRPSRAVSSPDDEQHKLKFCFQPRLSVDDFINLMRDLLRTYTTPSVAAQIERARHEAEYDERKTIVRFRKLLPPILEEVYKSHGLDGQTYDDLKRQFDRHLTFYGPQCNMAADQREELTKLVTGCREALFGDVDAAN